MVQDSEVMECMLLIVIIIRHLNHYRLNCALTSMANNSTRIGILDVRSSEDVLFVMDGLGKKSIIR